MGFSSMIYAAGPIFAALATLDASSPRCLPASKPRCLAVSLLHDTAPHSLLPGRPPTRSGSPLPGTPSRSSHPSYPFALPSPPSFRSSPSFPILPRSSPLFPPFTPDSLHTFPAPHTSRSSHPPRSLPCLGTFSRTSRPSILPALPLSPVLPGTALHVPPFPLSPGTPSRTFRSFRPSTLPTLAALSRKRPGNSPGTPRNAPAAHPPFFRKHPGTARQPPCEAPPLRGRPSRPSSPAAHFIYINMYQKIMRKVSTLYCIIQRNLFIFALSNNKQHKQ